MIRQVKTHRVTLAYIMSRAAFKKGFEDKKNNRPFDESYRDPNDQWFYERGRLFACIYDGQIKNGRTVIYDAQLAYHRAQRAGEIL